MVSEYGASNDTPRHTNTTHHTTPSIMHIWCDVTIPLLMVTGLFCMMLCAAPGVGFKIDYLVRIIYKYITTVICCAAFVRTCSYGFNKKYSSCISVKILTFTSRTAKLYAGGKENEYTV